MTSERELFTAQSAREHVVWCTEDISHLILSLDAAEQARVCGPGEVPVRVSDLRATFRATFSTMKWCPNCGENECVSDCWLATALKGEA